MNKQIAYLACPYTHQSAIVMRERFEKVSKCAGLLMQKGHIIFSPISHTHPIAMQCKLPVEWRYWEKFDTVYLSVCYKMFVLKLQGWETSTGITNEIEIATHLGLEIEYINEDFIL